MNFIHILLDVIETIAIVIVIVALQLLYVHTGLFIYTLLSSSS